MRNEIICRFDNENDLNEFNKRNNLSLTSDTVEYNTTTKEYKYKKQINRTPKTKVEEWKEHWKDMPEYVSEKQKVFAKVIFKFDKNDLEIAKEMFNQNITYKTTSVWYPKLEIGKYSNFRFVGGDSNTKYPIYVISKNRSDKCTTSKYLSQMEVNHYVVVEPQEFEIYKNKVENKYATILELDMNYRKKYDTFDNDINNPNVGAGGARNFCWDDSIKKGYSWHWVMDDNANEGFHYMYKNKKIKCRTGEIFKAVEDFVDRYENIAIAGLNYSKFCKESDKTPPYVLNTRIYSFLLIRNDIPYRWRGRYNEDTDLSLRVLKDGWCTIQFNAFLAGKATTQKISGGNTDEFYSKEGTYPKSKMLEDMHPDVAKVVWKFNRWHHQVDYSRFIQKLIFKDNIHIENKINNYGMKLIKTEEMNTDDTKSYLENKYKDQLI